MVGLGVAAIGLTAIAAVVSAGGQLAMNTEMAVAANDVTRVSVETMVSSLRNSAFGAQNGLVVRAGGNMQVLNPVYGTDNTGLNFSDELWVLVPHRGVFLEGCFDRGAALVVSMAASSATSLPLSACGAGSTTVSGIAPNTVGSFLTNEPMLLVSAGKRGALLTNANVSATSITYAEMGTNGFGTDEYGAGFNAGDQVFPVRVLHYFVSMPGAPCPAPGPLPAPIPGINTIGKDLMPDCAPGLYVADAIPNGGSANPPFVDSGPAALVMSNVEDLQVAWAVDGPGTGNPANFAFQNGLAPTPFTPNLRAIRVSIVSRTARPQRSSDTTNAASTSAVFRPLTIENHVPPAAAPDGYRRTVYTRRVELINLAPRSL